MPDASADLDANAVADGLTEATRSGRGVAPPRTMGVATLDDAYAVQQCLVAAAVADGRRVVGNKVGLTSRVMQEQLGVDEPDFGVLFDDMVLDDGADLATVPYPLVAPRVEAEIAFLLGRDVTGPGTTAVDVLRATEAVTASLEVIDSRVANWDIELVDTVADNASSAYAVLGSGLRDPRQVDLALAGVVMRSGGEVVGTGAGAAALGHPANAVAWLANTLAARGECLSAGAVVLSGACHAAVAVAPGDAVEAEIAGLGGVRLRWSATPTAAAVA